MDKRDWTRKDIKQFVCDFLSELDSFMKEEGFERRKNGLVYTRKTGITIQKIDMVFYSNPSYCKNALAHIYPHIQIYFPEINNTAKTIADNLIPEKWIDEFTIRQPIQVFTNSKDWYLSEPDHYEPIKSEILAFLEQHTMPLLDLLTCEDAYLTLYESKDRRIIWDDNQYLYIISAYVNRKEYRKAQQVFEQRFGKPGVRKRYEKVLCILKERETIES